MRIDVLTLFPDMFAGVLGASILRRAAVPIADPAAPDDPARVRPPVVSYHLHDTRAWSDDARHRKVDASPYGGGPGMVMRCQPIWDAVRAVEAMDATPPTRVLLTPKGRPLTQRLAEGLATRPRLLLIAGHYEGLDQRVIDRLHATPPFTLSAPPFTPSAPPAAADVNPSTQSFDGNGATGAVGAVGDDHLLEISVGDYVLSGGELPAMTLIDAVVRLLPGALGHADSAREDSFSPGADRLLDHPHYTRPPEWAGLAVPEVLTGGDHAAVAAWRREAALATTRRVRPDLLAPAGVAASPHPGPALTVVLRDAAEADLPAIMSLHRAAFGHDGAADATRALTENGDDPISLVAELAGRVVAHAVLSVVKLESEPALRGLLALGPVSVEPSLQRRGMGSALVREAIRQCHDARVQRLFTVGGRAFFARFGFVPAAEQGFTADPGHTPLGVLTVRDTRPVEPGRVRLHPAMKDLAWI